MRAITHAGRHALPSLQGMLMDGEGLDLTAFDSAEELETLGEKLCFQYCKTARPGIEMFCHELYHVPLAELDFPVQKWWDLTSGG